MKIFMNLKNKKTKKKNVKNKDQVEREQENTESKIIYKRLLIKFKIRDEMFAS